MNLSELTIDLLYFLLAIFADVGAALMAAMIVLAVVDAMVAIVQILRR